jgi:hypothetical protein
MALDLSGGVIASTVRPGGVGAIVRVAYQDDVSSGGAARIDYVT